MVIRFNNSGPDPDDILCDQPLGCARRRHPATLNPLKP